MGFILNTHFWVFSLILLSQFGLLRRDIDTFIYSLSARNDGRLVVFFRPN